jgi:hypothetical protein
MGVYSVASKIISRTDINEGEIEMGEMNAIELDIALAEIASQLPGVNLEHIRASLEVSDRTAIDRVRREVKRIAREEKVRKREEEARQVWMENATRPSRQR